MSSGGPAYVFDFKALRKVYGERTSNALIDRISEKSKAGLLFVAAIIREEMKDIAEGELAFLQGIEGFKGVWVNPPEDIFDMAVAINQMDGGSRLSEADQWNLAIANVRKCFFVVERKGKKLEDIKKVADKLPNVDVISFDEFKDNEDL